MNSVPILTEPKDAMRVGFGQLHAGTEAPSHPVEVIQKTSAAQQKQSRENILAAVYGSHVPMRLKMEQMMVSRMHRAPGLVSSFAGLETLTGADELVEFEDFLCDPQNREKSVDVFSVMAMRAGAFH